MEKIIIEYLPFLAIVLATNFATGIYKNVNVFGFKFEFKKLINGIVKALIISGSFVGTAVVYDKIGGISLANIELPPDLILKGAIVMYLVKSLDNLKNILKLPKEIANEFKGE